MKNGKEDYIASPGGVSGIDQDKWEILPNKSNTYEVAQNGSHNNSSNVTGNGSINVSSNRAKKELVFFLVGSRCNKNKNKNKNKNVNRIEKRLVSCSKLSNSPGGALQGVSILDYCVVMPLFLTLSLKKGSSLENTENLKFCRLGLKSNLDCSRTFSISINPLLSKFILS